MKQTIQKLEKELEEKRIRQEVDFEAATKKTYQEIMEEYRNNPETAIARVLITERDSLENVYKKVRERMKKDDLEDKE